MGLDRAIGTWDAYAMKITIEGEAAELSRVIMRFDDVKPAAQSDTKTASRVKQGPMDPRSFVSYLFNVAKDPQGP